MIYKENKVCTDEEYLKMGFSVDELPMIQRHTHIFNRYVRAENAGRRLKERQMSEMFELQARLGL